MTEAKAKQDKTKEVKKQVALTAEQKRNFIQRKLSVLNQKDGAVYERNAVRVVENNK